MECIFNKLTSDKSVDSPPSLVTVEVVKEQTVNRFTVLSDGDLRGSMSKSITSMCDPRLSWGPYYYKIRRKGVEDFYTEEWPWYFVGPLCTPELYYVWVWDRSHTSVPVFTNRCFFESPSPSPYLYHLEVNSK